LTNQTTRTPEEKDYLWLQLRDLPYFRALLRAVEARYYEDIDLPGPVLDLGCGDGHFATIAFDEPLDVGIDPWAGPVRQAAKRGSYRMVIHGTGDRMPFPDQYFSSVVSNSVLEHIPDLDPVLEEVARVLKPGGRFVFCVPNHHFLDNLSVSAFFEQAGLAGLGQAYRGFFNRISRHHHCDSPEVWQERLGRAGFQVERWWHYFSPQALHVLEWGHYFGLPSLVSRQLFGRWILSQTRWNLALTTRITEPYYNEAQQQDQGSYSFYITRKR
jgi:SAM-dependent methyltransferase